jgi:aspartyl-tRNA synthetase
MLLNFQITYMIMHLKTYGNDKPDIRFEMKFGELNEVSQHKDFPVFNSAELVVRIAAPGCATYTRKEMGIN